MTGPAAGSARPEPPASDTAGPDVAAPLDELLTQAALGPVRRMLPGGAAVRFLAAAGRRPRQVGGRLATLTADLARIAAGRSDLAPGARDRRFADPAWTGNPLLHRLVQAYLAAGHAVDGIVQDVPLDWPDGERIRFAAENLVDALAPSNNPLVSPLAWKAVLDTGGANLINGPRQLISDMVSAPRVPSMVDRRAFTVGGNVATSPGSVVLRTPVLEVLQYRPQTETVRSIPVLVVPPTINKYYVLDLAPGRSLVEYLVGQGQQVFMISWRNPRAEHRAWGFDEYVTAIIQALDAVQEITGADQVHPIAACSGGLLTALTAAHQATAGVAGSPGRLAGLTLLVTMIDQRQGGTVSALLDARAAGRAIDKSRRAGFLDGRSLAEVFAWLRPNDLIWNYWVANYLQGRPPPAFDILYWNADTTRMAAALHRDFIDVALHDKLARPHEVTVLGAPIDLRAISVDAYVVAGSADHICPWVNCYRSSQLLGGQVRFVLSTNGHIAALVNPPGNRKSSFQASDDNTRDAEEWRRETPTSPGTWWSDYAEWLGARSGESRPAPTDLGSARHRPIEAAPGRYVHEK